MASELGMYNRNSVTCPLHSPALHSMHELFGLPNSDSSGFCSSGRGFCPSGTSVFPQLLRQVRAADLLGGSFRDLVVLHASVYLVFVADRLQTYFLKTHLAKGCRMGKKFFESKSVLEDLASFSPWQSAETISLLEAQQSCSLLPAGSITSGCWTSRFRKASLVSWSLLLYPGCDHKQPELN